MSEVAQEESTTGIGLTDVPNTQEEATPAPDEAYQDAAEAQDEMSSSLSLDDVSNEVRGDGQDAEPAPKLYLVVAPTVGFARVQEMATLDDLRAELIALEGEDVRVFIFAGERFQVSKAPYRHLIPASGEPIELFDLPEAEALEIDDEGYLGPPPWSLEIPPPLPEELDGEGGAEDPDGRGDDLDDEAPP